MSLTDDLTQTYNRRHALFRPGAVLPLSTYAISHFALIYIDLNGFKQVNDLFGHQAGDMFLFRSSRGGAQGASANPICCSAWAEMNS